MQQHKAIIIGSGVAGLAAAIRLAVRGFEVVVYEKNERAGGKIAVIEKDGFRFDAGPSLFTQPANIEALFELAGENMDDYFSYQPVTVACRYFFENGKVINGYTDPNQFAAEMQEKTGEPRENILRYLHNAGKRYSSLGNIFLEHSLHDKKTWFTKDIFKALQHTRASYLFTSLNTYNSKQFVAAETIQLFNRFATYNGSNPYKAPAMLSMIAHVEFNEGIYYPKNGMISIAEALYKLGLKKNVRFCFNTAVTKILYSNNKAEGIEVHNDKVYAPVIVSNADINDTYRYLLGNQQRFSRLQKQERSSSAVIFYWGIKKQFPQLDLHNILFAKDYAAEFDHVFNKKNIYNDPTVYINITTKYDPSHAPEGKENWFVMINVPSDSGQQWNELVIELKQYVVHKINRLLKTSIESLIETEEIYTPQTIAGKMGSYRGALYGASSNSRLSAFLRHPNVVSSIKGLYCCGGTVHPGGGIPLCLKSAKIVDSYITV